MKRTKRSVNLNAEEMYNQFPKVKSGCKTGRIAAHENLDVINMTIPIVEFVKRRFRNQKLSLSTNRKLKILLNFPFPFVSFNPETRNFGLENHSMVVFTDGVTALGP